MSSPRPWGCFYTDAQFTAFKNVVPTPVGVFLRPEIPRPKHQRRPHARGGVSQAGYVASLLSQSSPRPWGCFYLLETPSGIYVVVPTPVGVFLISTTSCLRRWRRPHARGGVSDTFYYACADAESSPRPWGCFCSGKGFVKAGFVVPTPVGVFLPYTFSSVRIACRPHARGGVSTVVPIPAFSVRSSPRPWGCFPALMATCLTHTVVPTPVGVFPGVGMSAFRVRGRPHARGGVSAKKEAA